MEHPPESVTLSVVIPVYNEAATIATLLARVQAVPFETEIILVDDGSTDGTWDIVQACADVPNITLVRRARNQGKERYGSRCGAQGGGGGDGTRLEAEVGYGLRSALDRDADQRVSQTAQTV